MLSKVNWFGVVGGVAAFLLLVISLFMPWWQLKAGENLVEAYVSPLNINFKVFGIPLSVPLIFALNLASVLSLAAGGAVMLIYSFMPGKSYSKRLLGFAYNKPLFIILFFAVSLFALPLLIKGLLGFDVPIIGSTVVQMPKALTQGATVSMTVSAGFEWPFWFAIVVAGLFVAARLYHRKVAKLPAVDKISQNSFMKHPELDV